MSKEMSRDEELTWEGFMQGLDVTSGELVDGARKECENPLTLRSCRRCIWVALTPKYKKGSCMPVVPKKSLGKKLLRANLHHGP
jgi:hypothetical protein